MQRIRRQQVVDVGSQAGQESGIFPPHDGIAEHAHVQSPWRIAARTLLMSALISPELRRSNNRTPRFQ